MKNIHILPTDKPSKGYVLGKCIKNLSDVKIGQFTKTYYLMFDKEYFQPQNIYIISDEEIKVGDWCYQVELNDGKVDKCYDVTLYHTWTNNGVDKTRRFKKIILTTDVDLIKDGIQAIDDEFLEWFVKNPSCEEVEVVGDDCYYEIIIPKEEPKEIKCYCGHTTYCDCSPLEEPKQETLEEPTMIDDWLNEYGDPEIYKKVEKQLELEEAAEKVYPNEGFKDEIWADLGEVFREKFIEGAKWQAERSYSEEEVKHIVSEALQSALVGYDLEQWFTQFRKK